jgi:hypothetical protein
MAGVVVITETRIEKTCPRCAESKPIEPFARDRSRKDGRQNKCRSCRSDYYHANSERLCQQRRDYNHRNANRASEYWQTNADRQSANRLVRKYGITREEYDAILEAQGGCCAICESDSPRKRGARRFAVDHCHTTGQVRGLLCIPCNTAIGGLRDDPGLLLRAIEYLRKHKVVVTCP